MKLLAVSTSCFSATNREIYRRLESIGFEIKLLVPKQWNFGRGVVDSEKIQKGDPTIEFLEPTNFHQRLYSLKGIKKSIEKFQPDAIYLEGDPGSLISAILGYQAKRRGIQFLALSCENLSQSPFAVVKREGIKSIFSACIKYALISYSKRKISTLLVINKEGLQYFKRIGFKNVVKTPLGFNEGVFKYDTTAREGKRKNLNIGNQTVIISYFGRLVYEKGVHILIQALANLQSKNWVFLIDEFSRYKTDYQKKIADQIDEIGIKDKTIFFEADHLEIASYMNASDITVLPSLPTNKWVEQYGRVVPEAMACGNLMIVSNKGAQADFFDLSYPFTYNPEDISELTRLLEKGIETIVNQEFSLAEQAERAEIEFGLNAQIKILKQALINH